MKKLIPALAHFLLLTIMATALCLAALGALALLAAGVCLSAAWWGITAGALISRILLFAAAVTALLVAAAAAAEAAGRMGGAKK